MLTSEALIERARGGLDRVTELLDDPLSRVMSDAEEQFKKDIRLATTDEVVRKRRTKFLISLIM